MSRRYPGAAGSSPRMRGKLTLAVMGGSFSGLIPAHAGKTCLGEAVPGCRRAHPRACGENLFDAASTCWKRGSSPRMRGKHRCIGNSAGKNRLIPAHAGKTRGLWLGQVQRAAHPRACGENHNNRGQRLGNGGSSPRMRGKQPEWTAYYRSEGLIPAHAGKTGYVYDRPRRGKAHPRACGENDVLG